MFFSERDMIWNFLAVAAFCLPHNFDMIEKVHDRPILEPVGVGDY